MLDDGATLVSATDLKSRITYCNPAFVAASGYAREELVGQPHNLIRHPDMPAEAFRDMWATLQSGQPWTALVKNRRKCGDHYWVRANVTPVLENGHVVGYMSVRTKPGRDEVAAAEALYARMREEAAAGRIVTTLQAGELLVRTPAARLARLLRPGHAAQVAAAAAAAPLAVSGAAVVAGASWLPMLGAGIVAAALAAWSLRALAIAPLGRATEVANRLKQRIGRLDEAALKAILKQLDK